MSLACFVWWSKEATLRYIWHLTHFWHLPGRRHGNPLQYSCLENPMDRGAWRATVHRVAESWTRLKWCSTHTYFPIIPKLSPDCNSTPWECLSQQKEAQILFFFFFSVFLLPLFWINFKHSEGHLNCTKNYTPFSKIYHLSTFHSIYHYLYRFYMRG